MRQITSSTEFKVVKNATLLKSLSSQGIIKLDPQTLTKTYWQGRFFTVHYIGEAPSQFEYKGRTFGQKYFDGCFKPYLVEYIFS